LLSYGNMYMLIR